MILTALDVEYRAVRANLRDLREERHPRGTIYQVGRFAGDSGIWEVATVEIGPGNSGAAMEAERAIAHFDPQVILFVGVAGGLKMSRSETSCRAPRCTTTRPARIVARSSRPDLGLSPYELVQLARSEGRKDDWLARATGPPVTAPPRVLIAPIAAGEQVVASRHSSTARLLRHHTAMRWRSRWRVASPNATTRTRR